MAVALAAGSTLDPYAIFSRARRRWQTQAYPRFLTYSVVVSGFDGKHTVVNTYASSTDTAGGVVHVRATSAEETAHPYAPGGVAFKANVSISYAGKSVLGAPPTGDGPPATIEVRKTMQMTQPQPFDLLGVPMLSPVYSFGLLPPTVLSLGPAAHAPSPDLKTIASVTAAPREYSIAYDGIAAIDGAACYHLRLTPRGNPAVFRLRELWVNERDFSTVRALTQGNFTAGPGPELPWRIRFSMHDGLMYVDDETALAPVTYLGRTYSDVRIAFTNVNSAQALGPMWALSLFETSGDVLREPGS